MAAGETVCRYSPNETSQQNVEVRLIEEGSMHERLVAYVHTLDHGSRRGVWGEHSYARGEGEGGARGATRALALLAPRPVSPPERPLDVERLPSPPPLPPGAEEERTSDSEPEPEGGADTEEWEARVERAEGAGALDSVLCMRLARLAGGRGAGEAAARRLRRALAGGARAGLAAALAGGAPAWARRELAAARPRAGPAPPPGLRAPLGAHTEPWLVWVSSGCAALEARWERRLAGLVHTRVLRAGAGTQGAAGPPEAWCAAAAGAARSQLTDALAEAGDRCIILGGCGAGAALCLLLARGAGGAAHGAGGVRGAVLVAPPLHTAEGALPLAACRLPLLLLVGTRAHTQPRTRAHAIAELVEPGWGARRVLEVHGADEQLRLARSTARRLRLPQHALDAALAEECVRWALETAEGDVPASPPAPPPPPPPPPPAPRRHQLPTIVHQIDLDAPEEDYAHLPQAAAAPAPAPAPAPPSTPQSSRSIEIVEGRVVSRAAGGTPLPLLPPPRRGAPPSPAPSPAPAPAPAPALPSPADIMQMPIVFADDNATDSSSTGSPVTVTSGKARGSSLTPPVKMTRVILAKRGVRGGGAGAGAGAAGGLVQVRGGGAGGARGTGGAGGARRLLVRRGMRLVSRHDT